MDCGKEDEGLMISFANQIGIGTVTGLVLCRHGLIFSKPGARMFEVLFPLM
jgi:hypothetical protein